MSYAKEPFNLKLFILKMLEKWYQFVICTLVGAVLFGGGYYLYKVVYVPAREYEASATYYIEYAVDPRLNDACTYFNDYTLNSWVLEDVFVEQVMSLLSTEIKAEALEDYVEVTLPSDVRIMKLTVVTEEPVLTMELVKAYDTAFQTFAKTQKEIAEIRLQGMSSKAVQIKADIRTQRAFVLGSVLGLLIGGLVIILKYLLDDGIYLPLDLAKRHGLKVFGADISEELAENIRYAVKEKNRVAVTGIYVSSQLSEILEKLKQISPDTQWILADSVFPSVDKKTGEMLRECDGCVLAVMSGKDKSSAIDRALSYYAQQDIKILGAILCDADKKLLKRYER